MANNINCWNNQINASYNQIILNGGTNGVAISTDASAATVNVGTGAAVKTSTFGSTNSTSATTVQSGSGALAITSTNGTLTINSGTGALGISTDASATTVSFATGGAIKTVTLGSTNSTSATTVQSGSGALAVTSANGTWTGNSGTGTLGISTDASATTVNIATGGAVKTTTLGSTNSTSKTTIQAGSQGITLTGAVTSANAITVTAGNIVVSSGNITLAATSSSSIGSIVIDGNRWAHAYGLTADQNTFVGSTAGNYTLTTGAAQYNTGCGAAALASLTTGNTNTGCGRASLNLLTSGLSNAAFGMDSLFLLITGNYNTAVGVLAGSNYTGSESSNITIGYTIPGTNGESNVLRIGNGTGTGNGNLNSALICGITGKTTSTNCAVTYTDTANVLGTVAGGAVTMNTGTQSLSISSDASATTISIGTGAAVKGLTIGSTNTTSATAIKSGSGNIAMNSGITVDSTGRTTNSVQPSFVAYQSANVTNATGDNTAYTVICDTTTANRGANYNTGTGIFTAPITGLYQFQANVSTTNYVAQNTGTVTLVTTSKTYSGFSINPVNVISGAVGSGSVVFPVQTLASMTAGDTAKIVITIGNTTKTVTVSGASGSSLFTYFSGDLVC